VSAHYDVGQAVSSGTPTMPTMANECEITDRQIRALQREAAQAGDLDMVAICRTACGDHGIATQTEIQAARVRCAEVISDAEAQS
jgi:hypothetical protein